MKQGINNKVQIEPDVDFDLVEKIEIKFSQGDAGIVKVYPSTEAVLDDDGKTINVEITAAETYKFKAGDVSIDTRIKLVATRFQPNTERVTVKLYPTDFKKNE